MSRQYEELVSRRVKLSDDIHKVQLSKIWRLILKLIQFNFHAHIVELADNKLLNASPSRCAHDSRHQNVLQSVLIMILVIKRGDFFDLGVR